MAGTVKVTWRGAQVLPQLRAAEVRGLTLGGEHILTESRAIVPIEEATLERSGTVSVDVGGRRVAVSYDTVYAVIQHEAMDFHHDAGRSAKYLEIPFMGSRNVVLQLVAVQLRGVLS